MASELTIAHAYDDIYLTFNLRAEDLYDAELPHLLSQALSLWKLDSQNIVLEITEEGILELNETSSAVINNLSLLGFKLALDDFGTGFSSLSRLRTMPIDLIKIDQSFIRNIAHSKDDLKIVESIASLAHSLGKEVLAEGIEDEESFALIQKISVQKCQGYLFAKPMAYDDFISWLQSQA
jgi:EAL domain-containing protein (putative c-di-GMP-specific phosphodiesterase class I)